MRSRSSEKKQSTIARAASAIAQVVFHRVSPARGLRSGLVVLIAGLALVIGALATAEVVPLVLGTVTAGVGHGLTFRGGMSSIATRLEPSNRGAVISTFFVVLYTALSLPVVGVGLLAQVTSLRDAAIALSGLAAVLCVVSLLSLIHI